MAEAAVCSGAQARLHLDGAGRRRGCRPRDRPSPWCQLLHLDGHVGLMVLVPTGFETGREGPPWRRQRHGLGDPGPDLGVKPEELVLIIAGGKKRGDGVEVAAAGEDADITVPEAVGLRMWDQG